MAILSRSGGIYKRSLTSCSHCVLLSALTYALSPTPLITHHNHTPHRYDLKAHSEIVMAHDEDSYIKLLEADCQREHDAEEEHRKALKKKHQKQMQEKKEQEAKKANPNNPTTSNQSGYSEATSSQTKPKAKTVKAKAKAKKAAAASVDTEYYQLLGVSSGASASQIKKGYVRVNL